MSNTKLETKIATIKTGNQTLTLKIQSPSDEIYLDYHVEKIARSIAETTQQPVTISITETTTIVPNPKESTEEP